MVDNNTVATIMTDEVLVVHPGNTLEKVHQIFQQNNIHHIPVVNAEREVVGIISKSDYLLLCDHLTLFGREWNIENNKNLLKEKLKKNMKGKKMQE